MVCEILCSPTRNRTSLGRSPLVTENGKVFEGTMEKIVSEQNRLIAISSADIRGRFYVTTKEFFGFLFFFTFFNLIRYLVRI